MSQLTDRTDGAVITEFLSVADLLEEPALAQLYAFLFREGASTVPEIIDTLGLPQGTAYAYVNRLADADLIRSTTDEQPRSYEAREIDLTVTDADGSREYTITPLLIDAVGRRTTDDDIDAYIDRFGIAGLATALTYTVARERGEVTHRIMADDLDIAPVAAEIILQALRPIVHTYLDIEVPGASNSALPNSTDGE